MTAGEVLAATATVSGYTVEQLIGQSRRAPLVAYRHVAMWVCREVCAMSYPEIGAAFGGRHHTTIMHGVDKVRGRPVPYGPLANVLRNLAGDRPAPTVAEMLEAVDHE